MRKKAAAGDILGGALQAIENAWTEGVAPSGQLPGKPEQQAILTKLINEVLKVQNFALALSKGDLAPQLEAKGLIAGSLKSLQANLRHLTWQTKMVAKGDFSQKVYFLGEFSESFNLMINFLAEARDQIKLREADLLKVNANLKARNHEITVINKMSEALQTSLTWENAYPIIEHFAQELFPATTGVLYMQDPDTKSLKGVSRWGTSLPGGPEILPTDCWALRHGLIFFMEDMRKAPPCCHLSSPSAGLSACLPLQTQEKTLGLLRFQVEAVVPPEATDNLKVLAKTVRDQLSLALANIRLRENLQHQAIHDPLTDLFNRRYLVETLEREILRAQRKETALVVIMLDIDYFKRFNDNYGHEAGDHLLQILGAFLKSHIRGGDIACRYGGEEFVLILPDISMEAALTRAEDLRQGVSQLSVYHGEQLLENITISLGVAVFPEHAASTEGLLKAADEALYRAKAAGRNRVAVAESKN
ncbi:MAG: diguanylate cyclase [Thermodesulfobacteriota bacterium]